MMWLLIKVAVLSSTFGSSEFTTSKKPISFRGDSGKYLAISRTTAAFFGAASIYFPATKQAAAAAMIERDGDLVFPLEWYDNCLCCRFKVNNQEVRAIVDTGSPFLVVPTICTREWGCLSNYTRNEINRAPSMVDTIETFGGQKYHPKWRQIPVSLSSSVTMSLLVAAVGPNDRYVLRPGGGGV